MPKFPKKIDGAARAIAETVYQDFAIRQLRVCSVLRISENGRLELSHYPLVQGHSWHYLAKLVLRSPTGTGILPGTFADTMVAVTRHDASAVDSVRLRPIQGCCLKDYGDSHSREAVGLSIFLHAFPVSEPRLLLGTAVKEANQMNPP